MTNHVFSKVFILLGVPLLTITACQHQPKYPGPLSPEESVKTFHFSDSFRAELYAAEPLVADPISMIFGENGDVYVVEMADANMPDSIKGKGQIVVLKDLDKDGKADTSVVFATGLKEATTVLPWKGGLIVTAAPDILYLKDTDGDGKADIQKILFSGFFQDNDEAQITSLRFGVDNWIYANNDGEAGRVYSPQVRNSDTLEMRGADFRFRLDRQEFERTTGPGQYGQAIDDWGHRFFTKNSLHIQQVVIPWRYLHRNPYLPSDIGQSIKNVSDHDPIMFQLSETPYWRQERTNRRNKAFEDRGLPPSEYARDHFTGASGGTFYGGHVFGEEYYGSIFTGDVAGNLVHRDVLADPSDPHDPFYTSKRGTHDEKNEFIAATDSWFRPTNFETGPDGCLYVVDMYRQHIETPVSIPEDLAADMDFSAGSDMGRIYRILPKGYNAKFESFNLETKTSNELVELLSSPNRWWRLHAHKVLVERQDKSIVADVKTLLDSARDPKTRIQAIYVLEGLDALNADIIKNALIDPSAGIRENAAILAERYSACIPLLEKLLDDTSARVAFQATLSLGQFSGKNIIEDFEKVLKKYGNNSWYRTAVLSSVPGSSVDMFKQLTDNGSFLNKGTSWRNKFVKDIAFIVGARNDVKQIISLLTLSSSKGDSTLTAAVVNGLIAGQTVSEETDAGLKKQLKAIQNDYKTDASKGLDSLIKLYY